MGFRITTWNGEYYYLMSTLADCCAVNGIRYFTLQFLSLALSSDILIRHCSCMRARTDQGRNPFGYEPWRNKRTFEVRRLKCSAIGVS